MFRLPSALRAAVLYGLLAASHSEAITPSPVRPRADAPAITAVSDCHVEGTELYCHVETAEYRISGSVTASSYTDCHVHGAETRCRAPTGEVQIIAAQAAQTVTSTPAQTAASSITAVSDCHLHGTSLLCLAGTAEYLVHAPVTATQDIPPAYTGCHSHGIETFCEGPNGDEVEIHLATEEEHDETGSSTEPHCHFHAGVEHCTGGSESESSQPTCARVQRDYNIRLRVGLLFVMLATSSIGVFTPILIASYVSPNHAIFTVLRQFGTGVIISTAFIHLFTHANLMFQNECLGELAYESTASAILMAGLFLSFLIEYAGNRLIQWHESKAKPDSTESAEHAHSHEPTTARTDMVNITVLECGVIFHSLLIGLTLVVAGDTFFLTLFAVIVFHQMFEGVALGTRIAALGKPCPASTSTPEGGEVPGHNHAHGHEHYHIHDHSHDHHRAHGHHHDHDHDTPTPAPEPTIHATEPKHVSDSSSSTTSIPQPGTVTTSTFPMQRKLLLALAFALVTPIGMAIGIGVLKQFNGNDPSTIIAIGTLDALSAGILVWVGVVEMWAHDWMLGGEMTRASPVRTVLGLAALVCGMAVMSLLGKWA